MFWGQHFSLGRGFWGFAGVLGGFLRGLGILGCFWVFGAFQGFGLPSPTICLDWRDLGKLRVCAIFLGCSPLY